MSRTNATAVAKVLMDDYGPRLSGDNPDLDPFIETASSIVDDVVECATAKGKTLTAAKLELIERWLAAHFYAVSDKPYTSRSTVDASGSFAGQTAMYFESTLYGQHAMRLDPSGCLDAIGGKERKRAGGSWLGKNPSSQIDYEDRR